MKKNLIYSLFSLLAPILAISQGNFPENGQLFVDTVVPRIDISINPDTLEWIYENVESDIEFHAAFVFDNGTVRDTIDPVGFRLRGNTSRYSRKKSFKLSFNTWTQGGKYYGVEKLNLNGEHNDPSVMRSKLSWDILRMMNIPAPRANHVQVYINGEYYGLYINVEHIDEEFVESRFNNNDGNLFKCLYPADLKYLGNNPDLYKMMSGDRRVYELGTNEEVDDYTDLADFINVVNNSTDLKCELGEKFNVYDYLKIIAFDILTSNWDGYIFNKNNFYLYHNTATGKFEYVPYDVDNTYGIDWFGIDWGKRNMYSWHMTGNGEVRPLYTRLMNNPEFRNQYTYYMHQLVYEDIDLDSLTQAILDRRSKILPYVANDPYYPLDYGYSVADFLSSYVEGIGAHVPYGIIPFLETRINSIKDQLENTTVSPVIKYVQHIRESSDKVSVLAFAEDDQEGIEVKIVYQIEGDSQKTTDMYDDGNHNDGEAGDKVFGGEIAGIPNFSSVSYQVFAKDSMDNEQLLPCVPVTLPAAGSDTPKLFINEFMAANENTISDENDEFDDWVEIYNAENEAVWLGNKFLTDNLGNPAKWPMPDYYIQPGEFLLIWADEDQEQGIFHSNFKLSKDGEELGIFNDLQIAIDQYSFGVQSIDISEGRFHDGEDNWLFFTDPTPGASNLFVGTEETKPELSFRIYPNPSINGILYLNKTSNISVYDINGKLVFTGKDIDKINTQQFEKGMYFIKTNYGQSSKLIIL